MDWQALTDFITRRDPAFRKHIRGALPSEIAEFQMLSGVAALPRVYVDYLRMFGADSNGFPLSAERYTDIGTLLEVARQGAAAARQPTYPRTRFIWIGGQHDLSDETYWGDFYLDLSRGDRDDPGLVAHEFEEPYDSKVEPYLLDTRFSQFVQRQAFLSYEWPCYLAHRRLTMGFAATQLDAAFAATAQLLQRAGVKQALPGGPSLWIGMSDVASVCVATIEALVVVRIASAEPLDGARLSEIVQDGTESAKYVSDASEDT